MDETVSTEVTVPCAGADTEILSCPGNIEFVTEQMKSVLDVVDQTGNHGNNTAASTVACDQRDRILSEEEREKLEKDDKIISDFKQNKLEKEAQKNWDIFYKRNTTKFFKDRHWTTREFTELCGQPVAGDDKLTIFEVGCGVGNFMFPLLQELQNVFFYACDFSPRAVQFVKEHRLYDPGRCVAFQCDITQGEALAKNVPQESVDIVTLIFVLSAIHPDKMRLALENLRKVLRPGGCVLIRDYGLYDHAMLRFKPGHKLAENFYVRQDGTRAYFFSREKLTSIFQEAGFAMSSLHYVNRQTVNFKEQLSVPRVFVQGKFTKTSSPASSKTDDSSDPKLNIGTS